MSAASSAISSPPSGPAEPPPKKFRVSLSQIQSLTAQGRARLSPGEIHLFQQRGFLRSETASQALATISETTVSGPAAASSSHSPVLSHKILSPLQHSALHEASRAPVPSPGGATSSPFNKDTPRTESKSSKQSHPPFHNQIFMDTCSHLHPRHEDLALGTPDSPSQDISTNFRRHSESITVVSARHAARSASISTLSSYSIPIPSVDAPQSSLVGREPSPFGLANASFTSTGGGHHRRASGSPVVPIVSSPEGFRTVLYAASPALTLYSLPTTAIDETAFSPPPSHTATMDQFKFPASPNPHSASTSLQGIQFTAATSPTPSSPSIMVATPLMVSRSKRKSIPMRSPSWTDSQELSPGVIFQMPFGFPRSTKSPSLAGSDDGMAGTTPPSHYPSPASSTRHSGSVADMNDHGPFAGQATPASPITRSGLGIRVQEDFSEPEATHPLDQPTHSLQAIGVGTFDQNRVTSTQEGPKLKDVVGHSVTDPGQDCMPTPPSVSMISAHRMETPYEGTGKAIPTGIALGTPKSEKALADVEPAVAADGISLQPQDEIGASVIDDSQAGSKDSLATAHEEDMSLLPLWAQRQQSIRRQSLIPRSELDFVKGSGILPPPSTDLVIPGGARIKAYPPLLSDIVKYQEEIDAKNADLESEAAAQNATSNGAKRRKIVQGKGRGSISAQGMRHEDDVDDHQGTEHTDLSGLKRRRSSQAQDAEAILERQGASRYRRRAHDADGHGSFSPSSSPPAQDEAAQQQHGRHSGRAAMLGSPVELNPTSIEHSGTRRGLKGKGKQTKARQSVASHQHRREWSWDESHDAEHAQHHGDVSDAGDSRRDSSHQRRASISASTQLTSGKNNAKKGARSSLKKTGRKNSVADLNDSEDDSEGRERFRRVSLGVVPGADVEMMAIHSRGYQLKTLKPLLNAIQSEDEASDGGSTELGASKGARGGDGSGLKVKRAANNRATDALKLARKRSIQEELINSSTGPSKKAKSNGTTKTSKKNGSHASDTIKLGRKTGSARHSIHGPFDESLAMAEALMDMHDGTIDDDETEDEFDAHTGGADNEQSSDSQEDHDKSGARVTMKQSTKSVKHKKANIATKLSKAVNAPSPQLKKKKTTAADLSKPKQQNKHRESTSGAGHHGGHSFDSAGQGPSSGSGSSSKRCEACDVTDTPCWRPGYSSNTSLCNSCGLRYKKCNVFCTRDDCKYIPLKMEYTAMEEDRVRQGRDHLICVRCKGRVALPAC